MLGVWNCVRTTVCVIWTHSRNHYIFSGTTFLSSKCNLRRMNEYTGRNGDELIETLKIFFYARENKVRSLDFSRGVPKARQIVRAPRPIGLS